MTDPNDNMSEEKDYLAEGITSKMYQEFEKYVRRSGKLIIELDSEFTWDNRAIQDTSTIACICLNEKNGCELLFSQYGQLATIKNEDLLSDQHFRCIKKILLNNGFEYLSENGQPFRTRERMNGDWFNLYFDYKYFKKTIEVS